MKNIFISTTFLAIVAALLWSTAFAGVKIGLQYQTPLRFGSLRFILAGMMVFLVYGRWKNYLSEFKREWKFIFTIAFIQVVIQYGMFYLGMDLVPGALGAMIVGSSPLFIAFVAHFTHPDDKMNLIKTVSFLFGVAGIAVITLRKESEGLKDHWQYIGIILLILNNMASGYSNVLVSKYGKPLSPFILTSASLFMGGIMLFLVSLPVEGVKSVHFPLNYYLALIWLAFLSASAFSIWYSLLKRPGVKVSELNIWKFLIPVSGAGLSWLLVKGEHPDWISITGMIIISFSLVLMSYSGKNRNYISKNVILNHTRHKRAQ
jgi:drug/metabolite transporter (DMT)-like permease